MRKAIDTPTRILAAALRDEINATLDSSVSTDPESVFIDMAQRITLRLSGGPLAFSSGRQVAAERTFDILTEWLRAHPDYRCITQLDGDGKFDLTIGHRPPDGRHGVETPIFYVRGESLQDAYAQVAQVIALDGDIT